MIKPWVNFAFLYQPERIEFLKIALKTLSEWPVEKLMILITINNIGNEISAFEESLRSSHNNIVLNSVDITNVDPRILQWDHKNFLARFLDSEYTHFIYADADLVINYHIMDYWVKTKEMFDKYSKGFIPGTFRFENYNNSIRSVDTTYRTDIPTLKLININNQWFFSPQEPFQGVSIMDKELALEHLNSPYVNLDSVGIHGFGYGETAISAYIFENPPNGYTHRILIPLDNYEDCWIQHLPNNYAANSFKEHGKIHAYTMFQTIINQTKSYLNFMRGNLC